MPNAIDVADGRCDTMPTCRPTTSNKHDHGHVLPLSLRRYLFYTSQYGAAAKSSTCLSRDSPSVSNVMMIMADIDDDECTAHLSEQFNFSISILCNEIDAGNIVMLQMHHE